MTPSAADLARLSPDERRQLLTRLLAERDASAEQLAPCSYNQRSLWFMDQLAPESSQQNVVEAWRIRAPIDVGALHRAVSALVARHEVLRTTYEVRDGQPWQRIHARVPDGFVVHSLGECDEAALRAAIDADRERLFELTAGPIFRAALFTRTATDHVLQFGVHHIAADFWSLEIVHRELRELYGREIGAVPASAPALPPAPNYRDFARWQLDMLAGSDGEAHWEYWRRKLHGPPPRLDMPADRPRPPKQSFGRDAIQFLLSETLIGELRRRAAEEGATLFMLCLAAFECLLARCSGQEDIVIGSAASGRSRGDFAGMVGYFVNTVVFRGDLSGDPTFREFLRQVRADVLATLEHQDFSMEMVVERLKLPRDPSRGAISDANIIWDKPHSAGDWWVVEPGAHRAHIRMDWYGLPLESYPADMGGAPTDLGITAFEIGQTITINLWYATELFDRSTIERLGREFVTMLGAVAHDPDVPVSRIPMLDADERRRLRRDARAPELPIAADDSLPSRFGAMVERAPDAVAVSGARERLTYRELDHRATALAHRLVGAGVRRGDIIGLQLERDVALVVGVLGILKAGAAYLPIDAAYPDSRAEFMLADARAAALVTNRARATALAGTTIPRIFADDPPAEGGAADAAADAAAAATGEAPAADDLAYVIYTSGSTGQPKGVMVSHRNVLRLFDSTREWFSFAADDVWTLFHSIAFDFSVWELWGALLHGGRVVVVPFETTRSPEQFLDLLARERVTMLSQTPSAFRQLVAADASRALAPLALRTVVFGGEALDVHMLRPWFDRRGDETPRLVNMYGITETTVHATYRPIVRADLGARVRSPIGRALPDLHLLVLDPAGEPVPVGVPGELYVGGGGVARGYFARPELTKARFVSDLDASQPGARLYRSGDLVRRLADGDLEYLGRIDQQVKIRGFRIELGEIEAALSAHPAVGQCAAVVRPDAFDQPRLLVYVVARPEHDPSHAELQAHLRRSLPDYMIPSAFIRLPALPLTSNHKLDLRALPLPEQVASASARAYIPPSTDVERAIAAEWQRVLGAERVGVDDDFFELGGHSILATSVARWLRERFKMDFPVYAIFEAPTVRGIATRVEAMRQGRADDAPSSVVAREEFEL